jgi:hypothetical protein
MNETELQTLLRERTGTERTVYDALRKHGKMTDRQLRDLLHSPGSGPRDALVKLLPTGVIRYAGKAPTKGNPMQYEATPVMEIEETAAKYAVLKPKRTRRRRTSPGTRLAELRQMEPGDCRKWYPARDQILATLPVLSDTLKMAFWESVPLDELKLALDEIEELHDASGEALAAGRERMEHERRKAKVEKLSAKNGRTRAEQETADRLAENLRRKLIQS